jgi:hypothetical protein
MMIGVLECNFTSLAQTVFLAKNLHDDPFEDEYMQTVRRMDRKALSKIKKLDDDTFLLNLNRNIDDITGKFF